MRLQLILVLFTLAIGVVRPVTANPSTLAGAEALQGFSEQLIIDSASDTGGGNRVLSLTGSTIRKKLFFEIYTIAHYSDLEFDTEFSSPSNTHQLFNNILENGGTKQISMVFQRDLRAEQIQKALTQGVKRNCSGTELEDVKAALAEFRDAIDQDVNKNDRFALRWTHDGHLIARYQEQQILDIHSPLLARLLWTIWFGDNSVVERDALMQHVLKHKT